MTTIWVGANSNNYQVGRADKKIKYIVLHWIVGTLESADTTFQNPVRIASAHYGIGDGDVHQYVKDTDTAYHAGNFQVNQESIGIEHEGGPDLPISEATYYTSASLVADLAKKYNIPLDKSHIWLHREIKATQCPGNLDRERIISMAKTINGQGGNMLPTVLIRDVIKAIYRKMIGREIPDGDLANEEAKQPFSVEDTIGRFMSPDFYKLYDLHTSQEVKEAYDKGYEKGKSETSTGGTPPSSDPPMDDDNTGSGDSASSFFQALYNFIKNFFKGGG